ILRRPSRPTPFPYTTALPICEGEHRTADDQRGRRLRRFRDRTCGEDESDEEAASVAHENFRRRFVPRIKADERSGERGHDHERRSEEHTSELQSLAYLVCRLL